VLFDAGNTLVYVDPRRMGPLLADGGGDGELDSVRAAELEARRHLQARIAEGHVGTEPEVWREYFDTLFRAAHVPDEAVAQVGRRLRDTHAREHLWTYVEEGTRPALEALAEAGYRLGVISNADGRVEGVLERVGLRGLFEFVLDSEVVGAAKPDRRIFDEACRLLELEAAACLYVGDLYPVDYLGATGAGMDAVLLDPLGLHAGHAPVVRTLSELPGFVAARAARATATGFPPPAAGA
jgi:HAD superfamily hydrolase (TIGR01549 family)